MCRYRNIQVSGHLKLLYRMIPMFEHLDIPRQLLMILVEFGTICHNATIFDIISTPIDTISKLVDTISTLETIRHYFDTSRNYFDTIRHYFDTI